ncbi:MAG: transglycosylase SLT domain-containing protein [Oligoflexales bacterium]|nr:transglycosylase SLT domain-containing protein [Oligoflexales bacterium]
MRSCKHRRMFYILFFLLIFFGSCTSGDKAIQIDIMPSLEKAKTQQAPKDELERFEKNLQKFPEERNIVGDMIAILEARVDESNKDYDAAVRHWMKAIKAGKGEFGKTALEGWVIAYSRILKEKVTSDVLAGFILAETGDGKDSAFLLAEKLTKLESLSLRINDILQKNGISLSDENSANVSIPGKDGIPQDDLLLNKTVQNFCKIKGKNVSDKWEKWILSLSPSVIDYWSARTFECKGENEKARNIYEKNIPILAEDEKTAILALVSAERYAQLLRKIGKRDEASKAYGLLTKLLSVKGISHKEYGVSEIDFQLKKIDINLWAARYASITGDYTAAKSYVQEAFELIKTAHISSNNTNSKIKAALIDFQAEGYHILASRIAIEQNDYTAAISITQLALNLPGLSQEWKERYKWSLGLYNYVQKNYLEANKLWLQSISSNSEDELSKPRLYFWIARSYEQMGKFSEAKIYLEKLINEYPLNYYSVVGTQVGNTKVKFNFSDVFGDGTSLEKRLKEKSDFSFSSFRKDGKIRTLIFRSEMALASELDEFASKATRELFDNAKKMYSLKANIDQYVHVSRMFYQSGDYVNAIDLTSRLFRAKQDFWREYPEQILVYFPKPFNDIYKRNAMNNLIEEEMLFSISRQESKFTQDIESPAEAVGLMQLIVPTVVKFDSNLAGKDNGEIKKDLRSAEYNIYVGSIYAKHLNRYYKENKPAVYAAYNAGEYMADRWLKARVFQDILLWIEFVPFAETKHYIQEVWRNEKIYKALR